MKIILIFIFVLTYITTNLYSQYKYKQGEIEAKIKLNLTDESGNSTTFPSKYYCRIGILDKWIKCTLTSDTLYVILQAGHDLNIDVKELTLVYTTTSGTTLYNMKLTDTNIACSHSSYIDYRNYTSQILRLSKYVSNKEK
jgi:hypothetical protein